MGNEYLVYSGTVGERNCTERAARSRIGHLADARPRTIGVGYGVRCRLLNDKHRLLLAIAAAHIANSVAPSQTEWFMENWSLSRPTARPDPTNGRSSRRLNNRGSLLLCQCQISG